MMPETDITDIAGSHGSPLTGLSMMLTIDRFWLTLLTDRSDPGSMTTLVSMTEPIQDGIVDAVHNHMTE